MKCYIKYKNEITKAGQEYKKYKKWIQVKKTVQINWKGPVEDQEEAAVGLSLKL